MKKTFIFTLLLGMSLPIFAQQTDKAAVYTGSPNLKAFMDMRFGMFIHWGPVALRGTEIGWSRNHQVKQQDYDSLYHEFNPVFFNATAWVKAAKDAGMKYITITSKHHDGFCLWPSKYTNYHIGNTPFKRDVVGELARACQQQGVKLCIYYSVLDWYDRRYAEHNDGTKGPAADGNMKEYVVYMKQQLKELITNYHPYMLWFDGNWEGSWTYEMATDMYQYIKKLDPNVVVNNRLGKGNHKKIESKTVGDYATPEQEVGEINMDNAWETCMTMCNQWSWKPNDPMKSFEQCIRTLASTAGGNGNLLFNVGPMMDGRMEARQVFRLREMGDWLKRNGNVIYGTKGGPYKPDSVMACTRKGNKVHLLLLRAVGKELELKSIPGRNVVKVYRNSGDVLKFEEKEGKIRIAMPEGMKVEGCEVVVMEMDGAVEDLGLVARDGR
jgi:alpha-L-fucosidase